MQIPEWQVFLRPHSNRRIQAPQPELCTPIWGAPSPKSAGGIWTSPLDTETLSPFADHAANAELPYVRAWSRRSASAHTPPRFHAFLLHPQPGARILDIQSSAQWLDLVDRCALDPARPHTWPDWKQVATHDIDAIHVSAGVAAAQAHHGLEGWDVDSSLWLRWSFDQVLDLGQIEYIQDPSGAFRPNGLTALLANHPITQTPPAHGLD